MPFGSAGEILRVDLTKEKVTKEPTAHYSRDYIGGRGIDMKIFYDEVRPGIDALDPENLLLFGVGPLVGTLAPSSARTDVMSKSPITGLQGGSNFGGFFGAELKFAGYDNIAIKGRAKKPVYLWIKNENVEIRDASQVWGKDTFEMMTAIREELGDPEVKVVSIGPGGENLVRYACLVHDLGEGAGRMGMGAVMGSKKLKAIAIRGTKGVRIAKPKEFMEACTEIRKKTTTAAEYPEERMKIISRAREIIEAEGLPVPDIFPGYYFWPLIGNQQRATFGFKMEAPNSFTEKYRVKMQACIGCNKPCHSFVNVPDIGIWADVYCTAETEPIFGLQAQPKVMFEFSRLCEMMGLDIISTTHAIGTMMELYERGIITEKDTDGIPLKWGDRDAIIAMTQKIARREGFGDILAEGALRAARKIGRGAEKYVMHTKGLTHFVFDLRGDKAAALATAVGPHLIRSLPITWRWRPVRKLIEPLYETAKKIAGTEDAAVPNKYEGKPALIVFREHEDMVADMMGTCDQITTWGRDVSPLEVADMTRLFSACTGVDMDVKAVLKVAERVLNLERAFNVREGITRKDETLPERYFKEPLPDGYFKGEVLDRKKFEAMKDEYYRLRGWDGKTGIPTVQKLEELGLKSVADELIKLKKIPAETTKIEEDTVSASPRNI